MSTPPRKSWTGWSLTPRTELVDKGKGIAFVGTAQKSLTSQDYGNMDQETLIEKVSKLENEVRKLKYLLLFGNLWVKFSNNNISNPTLHFYKPIFSTPNLIIANLICEADVKYEIHSLMLDVGFLILGLFFCVS